MKSIQVSSEVEPENRDQGERESKNKTRRNSQRVLEHQIPFLPRISLERLVRSLLEQSVLRFLSENELESVVKRVPILLSLLDHLVPPKLDDLLDLGLDLRLGVVPGRSPPELVVIKTGALLAIVPRAADDGPASLGRFGGDGDASVRAVGGTTIGEGDGGEKRVGHGLEWEAGIGVRGEEKGGRGKAGERGGVDGSEGKEGVNGGRGGV